jgi:hypothetical protein
LIRQYIRQYEAQVIPLNGRQLYDMLEGKGRKPCMPRRKKISTTIAADSYAYLRSQVSAGKARNLAEALDRSLALLRRAERRKELERATASYFQNLPARVVAEEASLETALDESADEIDLAQ